MGKHCTTPALPIPMPVSVQELSGAPVIGYWMKMSRCEVHRSTPKNWAHICLVSKSKSSQDEEEKGQSFTFQIDNTTA